MSAVARHCTLCGHLKTLDLFPIRKNGKYGRSPRCKTCTAIRQALYRQSPEGAAAYRRYVSKNRDKKLAKLEQWREANPERIREVGAAYQRVYRRTPIGKCLHARQKAMMRLARADTLEAKLRQEQRIVEINQEIQRLREAKQAQAQRDELINA